MKKLLLIGAMSLSLVAGALVVLFGLGAIVTESIRQQCQPDGGSGVSTIVSLPSRGALTVKGRPITDPQMKNAATITQVAFKNGLSAQAALVAVMTAMQESTLINIPYGYPGSTSLGLFQQIAAWGPYAVRMDPARSAYMFYFGGQAGQNGLTDVMGWQHMAPGDAAQAVQRSGFPDAYAQHEREAAALVSALSTDSPVVISAVSQPVECATSPIEQAVLAALGRVDDPYDWGDSDGSGLVSWAYGRASVDIPATRSKLNAFRGDASAGVKATSLKGTSFAAGQLRRGDLVFYGDTEERVGMYVGATVGDGNVRVATYNILGSNHTSQASADRRIVTAAELISKNQFGVIGLQELRADQRSALLELGDGRLGIYPEQPIYGRTQLAVNSVIWDKTKLELISGRPTPMPYYFGGKRQDIPLVQLRDRSTGQRFYVVNTHDPAKPQFSRLRLKNAKAHLQLVKRLRSEGLPVVFTGDFNSGFDLRSSGNTTHQNKRANLTYCVMTTDGSMVNSYDALRGRTGCSQATSSEAGVGPVDHVYVSPDIEVTNHQIIKEHTGSDHPVVYADISFKGDRSKPASASVVTFDSGQVRIIDVPFADIEDVLRLKVTDPTILPVSYSGAWSPPMKPGTYYLPSTDGGRYGWRIHPVRGTSDFHNGIDLAAPTGVPVYSIGDGVVVKAYYDDCWGNLVVINHGELYSMYTHLSAFSVGVREGTAVDAGKQIGLIGNTGGCSAGAHLHFTVGTSLDILSGEQAGSIDPSRFVKP